MNKESEKTGVNWMFLDLNSFFASCEQQERPELRGKPVAVVQMLTDSTCAIAASQEAKKFGIKTGTAIWQAKQKCRDLVLVKARHRIYVDYHNRIIKAVNNCLPIEKVCSIDELACRLMGSERIVENARSLAHKVKQTILRQVGDGMTCSVGLAPSLFLGKVASDMQKPNGLVVITQNDLPHILYSLSLTDICGIGDRMEMRLNRLGIATVQDLLHAPREVLRQAWGGINGVLYHELLHGADLLFPSSTESHSIGHQHVLEPSLRTMGGAQQFSQHLLVKAAERLRNQNYFAKRLSLFLSRADIHEKWFDEIGFHETQDSAFLLERLRQLWKKAPTIKPIKVGIVLSGLVPAHRHQPDLFLDTQQPAQTSRKQIDRQALSPLMDRINRRYGRGAIGYGLPDNLVRQFTGHAAFQRVPEPWEF